MPKYTSTDLGSTLIQSETHTYDLTTTVDSLGSVTLEFGETFTISLDYSNIEILEQVLSEAKSFLEDQAIDHAGEGSGGNDKEYADDPRNW